MKSLVRKVLAIAIQISITFNLSAQVGINSNGAPPDPSAGLDINFPNKGFLPPRMNTSQRNAIASPTEGLVIYNTDEKTLNVYNGLSWALMVPFGCGQPFVDPRDGKVYNTVAIGTQCWMVQSINFGTRINGTVTQTNNGIIEKYCYDDLESNCDIYGGLYQWAEAVQYLNGATNTASWNPSPIGNIQGICPTGWHLPSDQELCILTTFLDPSANCSAVGMTSSTTGGKLKETGYAHWNSPNTGATNSSGFTALPGGHRVYTTGGYDNLHNNGNIMSTTEENPTSMFGRTFYNFTASAYRWSDNKANGHLWRCLKN